MYVREIIIENKEEETKKSEIREKTDLAREDQIN